MRTGLAFSIAGVPIIALIGGLPFVNRLEPSLFGMPFLLVWILGWVLASPIFLASAYALLHADGSSSVGGGRP